VERQPAGQRPRGSPNPTHSTRRKKSPRPRPGTKQGCWFSPLLFSLVLEFLDISQVIFHIKGIPIERWRVYVLMYLCPPMTSFACTSVYTLPSDVTHVSSCTCIYLCVCVHIRTHVCMYMNTFRYHWWHHLHLEKAQRIHIWRTLTASKWIYQTCWVRDRHTKVSVRIARKGSEKRTSHKHHKDQFRCESARCKTLRPVAGASKENGEELTQKNAKTSCARALEDLMLRWQCPQSIYGSHCEVPTAIFAKVGKWL
jgi:hypothetical protein